MAPARGNSVPVESALQRKRCEKSSRRSMPGENTPLRAELSSTATTTYDRCRP